MHQRAQPSNELVAVIVSIHLKPDCEAEFLALLTPVLDAMRDEATFINTVLHRDAEDPTRFMLYETWASRDDLVVVQLKRAYRQAYEARLPELVREPRQAQLWQPLRGDFNFLSAAALQLPGGSGTVIYSAAMSPLACSA